MRYVLPILMFFIYSSASAQDEKSLLHAVSEFNTALIQKDSVKLNHLLNDKLTYGHSTAWIETKQELINDLYNGKLVYNKIDQSLAQVTIEGSTSAVRANTELDVLMNGKQVQMKLHVLQVWIWKKKSWQLLSRQSTKI